MAAQPTGESMMHKSYRPSTVGLLPAAPGTHLVQAYFDAGQIDIVRAHIIGWQVHTDRSITPLLVDQRAADVETWTVIHPDGRVECSTGAVWTDEDTWVDELRRIRREAA